MKSITLHLDTRASQPLALEGIWNSTKRQIQNARKDNAIRVDDRVVIEIYGDQYVRAAVQENDTSDIMASNINVHKSYKNKFKLCGKEYELKSLHQSCHIANNDIYFGGNEYEHYWEALEGLQNKSVVIK